MPHTQDITALAVVLSAAVLAGIFMNRLRLPAAAGFILAGVVLGPTGFGLIETSSAIETLAELGVLMLLFIIGMELRLQNFRAALPLALGIAAAQIAATTALCLFAAQFDVAEERSAIVIGFMLAISSTAVAMKMMEDAGEKQSEAGRLATAVLIAQDLAVVPLLLVTAALARGGTHHTTVFIAFKVVLALALLAGFVGVLGRMKSFRFPFSEFFLKDPDIATLCVLGLCFAGAALSGLIGLSPALGAFLCGLAVGHSTLRPVALRSAPPVQSILLFTFFLSVGLLIDLDYVLREFWLILIALVAVAAGKTLLNLAILKLFQRPGDVAFRAALFLTPIGEFSFVLAAAGASAGALSPAGYKLALSVIALSLMVSPIWFVGARRAHVLAQRGITGVHALYRGSYRRELFILRVWRRRALALGRTAAGRATRRTDAHAHPLPDVYDFPWDDTRELPRIETTTAPAESDSPDRPDPGE
ncbi:MAG: cation:proton antiporter [Alphaproteobacteria bacterium]|nr:cation:proton antiporter [Alphaproteobacteria bacterium]